MARLGRAASVYLTLIFGELALTDHLRNLFQSLDDFNVTSPEDKNYNCFAWAASEDTRSWAPLADYYWPLNAPMVNTLDAFVVAFGTLGYERCMNGSLEDGFEKVAIYQRPSGVVSHMARQLPFGRWTSKIGDFEDIEHASPGELEGYEYGVVVQYMRRAVNSVTG